MWSWRTVPVCHRFFGQMCACQPRRINGKTPLSNQLFSSFLPLIILQPLPESDYNSSPETVGYRLRVWRTDGQGEDRTEDVEGAGRTSEATIEGLNPWTQYQVQIQAYNSIGPGPWSNTVAANTAESGTNTDLKKLKCLLVFNRAVWLILY